MQEPQLTQDPTRASLSSGDTALPPLFSYWKNHFHLGPAYSFHNPRHCLFPAYLFSVLSCMWHACPQIDSQNTQVKLTRVILYLELI